jgi:hypothetical protein
MQFLHFFNRDLAILCLPTHFPIFGFLDKRADGMANKRAIVNDEDRVGHTQPSSYTLGRLLTVSRRAVRRKATRKGYIDRTLSRNEVNTGCTCTVERIQRKKSKIELSPLASSAVPSRVRFLAKSDDLSVLLRSPYSHQPFYA